MAFVNRRSRLDLSEQKPAEARSAIRTFLEDEPGGTRKVYAALLHKIWSLLTEQRLDSEVRGWHVLVQNVRSAIAPRDQAGAERMVVLSDLLRESIHFAESNPVRQLIERPHHKRLLAILAVSGTYVRRQDLQAELGIKTAYLSNIMSDLAKHNLVERRECGKETELRLSLRGKELLGIEAHAADVIDKLTDALRKPFQQGAIIAGAVQPTAFDLFAVNRSPVKADPLASAKVGWRRMGVMSADDVRDAHRALGAPVPTRVLTTGLHTLQIVDELSAA